jgi:hypothetical protein
LIRLNLSNKKTDLQMHRQVQGEMVNVQIFLDNPDGYWEGAAFSENVRGTASDWHCW